MAREWPLTGRAAHKAWAVAALYDSGGVLLAGEPGVGKTRLAREVLDEAGRRFRSTRWVGATACAKAIPLGAFATLVDEAGTGGEASLLGRVGSLLREDVEVLAVDDAHLLDDASAALVHQLAVEGAVRLVVTLRHGQPAPDAVTALWKDGLIDRLEVPTLGEEDTGRLVEAGLGGQIDGPSRARLYAMTRGNALLLRHLVAGERRAGRLTPEEGTWRWSGDPEITPELGELIDARIGALSEPSHHLLELVAFGEPVGVDLLGELIDPLVVEEAAERGLINIEVRDRRLQATLGHPLYGEAVRSRTTPLRARRRRGELARALTTTGARRAGDALRLAVLSLDSDVKVDAGLLTTAANEAAQLSDWPLTERLLRAACDAGGGFEPLLTLAHVLSWTVRAAEAEDALARATALAATDAERARAGALRMFNEFFVQGRTTEVESLLVGPGSGSGTSWYSDGVRATLAAADNRLDEARDLGYRVIDAPDAPACTVTWAGYALVVAEALAGRADRITAVAERAIAAAASAPETAAQRFNISYWQAYGLLLAGHPHQARDCLGWLRDLPGAYAGAARDVTAARLALDTGRAAASARLYQGVRPFFPGHGGGWTAIFESACAQALAMTGDVPGARDALNRARLGRHPGVVLGEPEIGLAEAWVAAAEGALAEAARLAVGAAEQARDAGQFAIEAVARHAAVRFADTGQAERLAELATRVDGPRTAAAAAHAAALAARDPDSLLDAAGRLERLELTLAAADACAQAAELLRARGRVAPATFAAARAAALAHSCGEPSTPALRAVAAPVEISAREREVATLASAGLSNRQIAARLHVSVRTVEGHIYRACTRLGVTDRSALAALIAPVPRRDGVSPG
ncbi:MAG TPA: LuxR C-terminal-related transcriptional regulator [Pseudonocardia sp.]|jgi:DNA-binding NarL/FixJ family response regulator